MLLSNGRPTASSNGYFFESSLNYFEQTYRWVCITYRWVWQVGEKKTFWNEPVDEPALGLQNLSMGL